MIIDKSSDIRKAANKMGESLTGNIPTIWDGKKSILEMKENGFPHWRQMEWVGFYFQYLCEEAFSGFSEIPGPKYGRTGFDGYYVIPWDFKAHAMNTSSHKIIVNDSEAVGRAIGEFGGVGLVLAIGKVTYNDEQKSFKKWHDTVKGGRSKYEKERIERGAWSRLRKVSFELNQITFIHLTDDTLLKSGSFQSNFRNANGSPRREKILIDLELVDEDIINLIEF